MKRPSAHSSGPATSAAAGSERALPFPAPNGLQLPLPAVAWLAAVACLGLLQPFLLGFYLDDWALMGKDAVLLGPFSRELWNSILHHDPTRPVSVVFRWLTCSLFRDVPGLWHAALVAANGIIVIQLAALARLLAPAAAGIPRSVPLCLAAAWMTLPWTSGIRFWPTTLNVHVYFIVFLGLTLYLVRQWRSGQGPVLAPFTAYLAVCLGYEALYMQFLVLAAVAAVELRRRAVPRAAVARSLAALAAAQACAVLWNQFARSALASPRQINPEWLALFWRNLRVTVPEMVGSFGPARWIAVPAFLIVMLGVAAAFRQGFKKRSMAWADLAAILILLLGLVCGSVISAAVFSVGGRPFSGFGVETRGLAVISLWAAAGMAFLVGLARAHAAGFTQRLLEAGIVLTASALLAGHLMQFRNWHEAARLQARLLSLVPVAAIANTEPGAEILCIFPHEIAGAPVFSSPWDLNSAMQVAYPALSGKHFVGYSPWGGPLRWDGAKLWSEYVPQNALPARILYLWRPLHGEFLRVERPIIVQYDLQWRYAD
jgi:hypothetical protein